MVGWHHQQDFEKTPGDSERQEPWCPQGRKEMDTAERLNNKQKTQVLFLSSIQGSISSVQFSSFQSLSCVWLIATPWIAARQASLSITNSPNSLKLMSIESVMPSSHLILCRHLFLLPSIPPSFRVFPNESTLHIGKNTALTTWNFVGKVTSLLFNMLSKLVITFLPRSKRLLISWLPSPSAVILEPPKIKSASVSTVSPSISHEVMGPDLCFLNVEL